MASTCATYQVQTSWVFTRIFRRRIGHAPIIFYEFGLDFFTRRCSSCTHGRIEGRASIVSVMPREIRTCPATRKIERRSKLSVKKTSYPVGPTLHAFERAMQVILFVFYFFAHPIYYLRTSSLLPKKQNKKNS